MCVREYIQQEGFGVAFFASGPGLGFIMYIFTTLEFPTYNFDFHLLTTSVNANYIYFFLSFFWEGGLVSGEVNVGNLQYFASFVSQNCLKEVRKDCEEYYEYMKSLPVVSSKLLEEREATRENQCIYYNYTVIKDFLFCIRVY